MCDYAPSIPDLYISPLDETLAKDSLYFRQIVDHLLMKWKWVRGQGFLVPTEEGCL